MTTVDQRNNFYHFHCEQRERSAYYGACLSIMRKIGVGKGIMFEDCAASIERKRCPALAMFDREIEEGKTIFYVDRDDAGVGVVSRQALSIKERSGDERKDHHDILAAFDIEPNENKIVHHVVRTEPTTPVYKRGNRKSAQVENAFDLGALITEEVAAL